MQATEQSDSLASAPATGQVVLSLRDIKKSFGGVEALQGASLDVVSGKVTALVGDNGAGKSTLIKTVMGVHQPTSGSIWIDDQETTIASPDVARKYGLEAIYQDLALIGTFDLVSNFFLGHEKTKSYLGGLINVLDKKAMREEAIQVLTEQVGINIGNPYACLLYTSPSPRDGLLSRMPSSA